MQNWKGGVDQSPHPKWVQNTNNRLSSGGILVMLIWVLTAKDTGSVIDLSPSFTSLKVAGILNWVFYKSIKSSVSVAISFTWQLCVVLPPSLHFHRNKTTTSHIPFKKEVIHPIIALAPNKPRAYNKGNLSHVRWKLNQMPWVCTAYSTQVWTELFTFELRFIYLMRSGEGGCSPHPHPTPPPLPGAGTTKQGEYRATLFQALGSVGYSERIGDIWNI